MLRCEVQRRLVAAELPADADEVSGVIGEAFHDAAAEITLAAQVLDDCSKADPCTAKAAALYVAAERLRAMGDAA